MPLTLVFAGFLVLSSTISASAGPSFDCRKATKSDEIVVCGNPKLAELDTQIAATYKLVIRKDHIAEAKQIARNHVKEREACLVDFECIKNVQLSTLAAMERIAAGPGIQPAYTNKRDKPANPNEGLTAEKNSTNALAKPGNYENPSQIVRLGQEHPDFPDLRNAIAVFVDENNRRYRLLILSDYSLNSQSLKDCANNGPLCPAKDEYILNGPLLIRWGVVKWGDVNHFCLEYQKTDSCFAKTGNLHPKDGKPYTFEVAGELASSPGTQLRLNLVSLRKLHSEDI